MGSGVYMWVKISFIFYSKVFVFLFVFIKSKFFLENIVNSVMTQYFHLVNCHPKKQPWASSPTYYNCIRTSGSPYHRTCARAHTHTLSSFHSQFHCCWPCFPFQTLKLYDQIPLFILSVCLLPKMASVLMVGTVSH